MKSDRLEKYYLAHGGKVSDKWSLYLSEYERLFLPLKRHPVRLLEIGTQNGGSLEIWSKLFPYAEHIIGCDINVQCRDLTFHDPRISLVIGDANSDEAEETIIGHSSSLNLIIDDGSHHSRDIIHSFIRYFPHLDDGGMYVIEDLHCSYWEEYEGGVFHPYSSIAFLKKFIDIVNHEHWGVDTSRRDILQGFTAKYDIRFDEELLGRIHSVEFINSLCVIRKASAPRNVLGPRVIVGTEESVLPDLSSLHGSFSPRPNQEANRWSARAVSVEEELLERIRELEILRKDLAERDERVGSLNEALKERDERVGSLNEALNERDERITSLNRALAEHKENIVLFAHELIASKEQIGALSRDLAEREEHIDVFRREVAGRDEQLAAMRQTLAERDWQIAALYRSTSWRITRPMRMVSRCLSCLQLVIPAFKRGGGVKSTLRKAFSIYRQEGLQGIQRGFEVLQASRLSPDREVPVQDCWQEVTHAAEELFPPRPLIIAEMSIPQCRKYRVQQKSEMLELLGVNATLIDWHDTQACLNALQTHSMVIFYRVPAYDSAKELIREARRLRLPTIWEVDDLIFDREILAKSKTVVALDRKIFDQLLEGADLYRTAMLLCDRGIASTAGLADAMKEAGLAEVQVIENALDRQSLEIAEKVCRDNKESHDGVVRIVYGSGTSTHNIDFQEAAPAIIRILDRFANVQFRLIGQLDLPEAFSRFESRIERVPFCSYEEYLRNLAECDVSVSPLENYIFNESKSNIKFLEASIVKVPSVCSPRSAFAQVISHGDNGFLCNSDEEWEAALTLLVTDLRKGRQIGEAAYSSVLRRYLPAFIAERQVAPVIERYARVCDALRVLSVNCLYNPRSFGGATIVAEEVNKRINSYDGYQVHVFTTLPSSLAPPYTVKRYESEGVNIYGVGMPDVIDEKTQFKNPEIEASFASVLEAVQPHIVHFHSIQGIGVSVMDLCRERGIRYVVTLHDTWWLCGRHFMVNRKGRFCGQEKIDPDVCAACVDDDKLNRYRSELLKTALLNASLLLAPSRYFAEFYGKNGFGHHLRVNRNGIARPVNFIRDRPRRKLRFGYVGGNTEIKGFHLVKKVFSDLPADKIQLILVDNVLNLGYTSYLPQDIEGIPDARILPAYTQETIDEFYSGIDVLLFPTRCKESFGLTVREALARGVWVISSDAGGVVEDIRHGQNGLIVPFSDEGAGLKQAVIETIEYFEGPRADAIEMEPPKITFFDQQASELAAILKEVVDRKNRPSNVQTKRQERPGEFLKQASERPCLGHLPK